MRAYEEYSTTQEICFPIIPSHWSMWKIKHLFSERIEKGFPKEQLLVASQNHGVIPKQEYGARTVEATKDLHLLKLVKKGDFVISLRSFQGGIEYAYSQGIISPAYTIMVPEGEILPSYFRLLAKSFPFIEVLKQCVTGIREGQNVDYYKLKNRQIPLPPRDEQDAIVRFLDAKCAKIDRLIKLKERQIALLNEKKQLMINQAVTRGLDPNAPMKDSGVDWIGEIPEGWEVSKLKYIGVIQTGVTLGKDYSQEATSKYPYLCVANVQDGYIDLKKIKFISLPPKEAQRFFLQKGDILMTEGGDPDKLGRGSVWNNEIAHCLHQNHIFAVRMDQKKVLISFFRFVLQAQYCKEYFLLSAKQTTNLASTNKTTLSNLYVAMPSLDAQEKIVEQLDKVVAIYKKQIKIIEKEILTLREYKIKIISDCVTGKLNCMAGNDITIGENHV